jgi:phage portal protein BeeE
MAGWARWTALQTLPAARLGLLLHQCHCPEHRRVPLNFYAGTKKNKRLVETGPLSRSLKPEPLMSGAQLIEATMIFLGITGEAFYILDRSTPREVPKEIWTFHPSRFEHVPDPNSGLTRGWLYRKGSKQIPLEPHEVVFFRYFNPYNDYRGFSPIEAAQLSIDQDWYAGQYNRNFFVNSAQTSAVLESKENLMQEEFDRLLAQWNDRHQGVDKAHQVALLEGGITYKQTGISQRDMDFLEGRKYSRDEILRSQGAQGRSGIEDDTGSYAKDKVRRKLFWETTLEPKMVLLEYVLWSQLCRLITGPEVWPEFDRKSIPALQEDRGLLLDQAKTLWGMGYPADVVNEYLDLGLPEIEGGGIGYLPFNLVPAGSAVALPEPTAAAPAPRRRHSYHRPAGLPTPLPGPTRRPELLAEFQPAAHGHGGEVSQQNQAVLLRAAQGPTPTPGRQTGRQGHPEGNGRRPPVQPGRGQPEITEGGLGILAERRPTGGPVYLR